jgi:hypothetical protein
MTRFRKKPVVIEAMQWTGTMPGWEPLYDFCRRPDGSVALTGPHPMGDGDDGLRASIETPEGIMFANPGDWIIRGVRGEFYPCKPDIFAAALPDVPVCR